MPRTVNPPPRAGSDGSGRRSSPASCAARSRCAMASDSVASARSLSAAVTRSSGQMPPMSATAVASATTRLARRIAAATRSRRARARSPPAPPSPRRPPRPGPRRTSARRLAASRTARSARNGLLPPSARSSAATAGRPPAAPRHDRVRRSVRSAAPPHPYRAGVGQVAGRWKVVSVMRGKAGREASPRSSRARLRHGCCIGWSPWRSRWRCWAASASRRSPGGCRRGRSICRGSPAGWRTRRTPTAARRGWRSVPPRWPGRASALGVDRPLDLRLTNVTVTDQPARAGA